MNIAVKIKIKELDKEKIKLNKLISFTNSKGRKYVIKKFGKTVFAVIAIFKEGDATL